MNILSVVINDNDCRNTILEDQDIYIKIVNNSGDVADDLKEKVKSLLKSNPSEKLSSFASAIGVTAP